MPEKSGIDAALWAPLRVGPTITVCPKAAAAEAAAAANIANERKSRRCTPIPPPLHQSGRNLSLMLYPLRVRLREARDVRTWPDLPSPASVGTAAVAE